MKYVTLLCDGMGDKPIAELEWKTPLEVANTPFMDEISKFSKIGMVQTVPNGFSPGSDTANLSVLGYAPEKYYSGRSPLEAISMGVKMNNTDISMRMNFVTLTENNGGFKEQKIIDHSADDISTEESIILLDTIRNNFENDNFKFYPGTAYRHCLIWRNGEIIPLVQPHDVLGQDVYNKLPIQKDLAFMMEKSFEILKDHPINIKRKKEGKGAANAIWFWGAGTKPLLDDFEEKTGLKGAMISAVDLLKGIAISANMKVINVEGANANIDTNYSGKGEAAIKLLLNENYDFVYIHVEAPDEMGHKGLLDKKILAIENIDKYILGPVFKALKNAGIDFKILVLPDHQTPISIRTHTSDSIPFMLFNSKNIINNNLKYNEKDAEISKNVYESGPALANYFYKS